MAKHRPPYINPLDRISAVYPPPNEYGLRKESDTPREYRQAHQAPRGVDVSQAGLIHGGNTVSRLPDIAFQPEAGLQIRDGINNPNCNSQFINAPVGTFVVFSTHFVSPTRKLVIVSADVYFSNPYSVMLVDTLIRVNGIACNMKPAVNRPCDCPYPLKIVANAGSMVTLEVAPLYEGYDYGTYSSMLTGWEVDDAYPLDKRFDL